jgi:type IV pilus assembly protein PilW
MPAQRKQQRGLTLVELMVALGISLVLILAASTLYLSTRATQKAVDERGQVFETGHMVMRILGRDLSRAGFYPLNAEEPNQPGKPPVKGQRFTYAKTVNAMTSDAPPAGLAFGVFGCDGTQVAKGFGGCSAAEADDDGHVANDSDGLLVSYFTSDSFSLDVGDRADCTRADAANDEVYNKDRVGTLVVSETKDGKSEDKEVSRQGAAALGLAPALPLLVVNRYALRPTSYTTESGVAVNTFELICRGNGAGGGRSTFASLIVGVEQLALRYGVFNDPNTRVPARFLTSAEVNELADLVVGTETFRPWQRVVSVEVCVMVRSFSRSDLASSGITLTDCENDPYTPDQGAVVRKMIQVFGLRNRQSLDTEGAV